MRIQKELVGIGIVALCLASGCSAKFDASTPEKAAETFVTAMNAGKSDWLERLYRRDEDADAATRKCELVQLTAKYRLSKYDPSAQIAGGSEAVMKDVETAFREEVRQLTAMNCDKIPETNAALLSFIHSKGAAFRVGKLSRPPGRTAEGHAVGGAEVLLPGTPECPPCDAVVFEEGSRSEWSVLKIATINGDNLAQNLADALVTSSEDGTTNSLGEYPPTSLWFSMGNTRRWASRNGFVPPK